VWATIETDVDGEVSGGDLGEAHAHVLRWDLGVNPERDGEPILHPFAAAGCRAPSHHQQWQ
jgi:hypothetical protein